MTPRPRRVLGAQYVSRMCLVCGVGNELGLHGRFLFLAPEPTEGIGPELLGLFAVRRQHQGYPGRLHGGIVTAILDETIGRAIAATDPDTWGVTAELRVRFRAPVPDEGQVRALARVTRDGSRMFLGTGEILLADGSVAVEGSGKYLKLPIDRIAPDILGHQEWFPDERCPPEQVLI
jgi:acyl-coenzyme A thioesterase PaaI-like protein